VLATLLLVFREVLEAALIVSIVAAATRGVSGRARWICAGLTIGIAGALLVAAFADLIANAMSGMGQEWFNASVLFAAVGMIGWHVIWMARHGRELAAQMQSVGADISNGQRPLTSLMVVVALAVLREGSEVVLFGYGLLAGGSSGASLILGGVFGLIAGVLVGFAMYFGLLKIPMRHFFNATNGLLVLLAAGLAASAVGYLTQADVLPTLVETLWDSSSLLTDDSMLGHALHVLIGYTAQPSGMQVLVYVVTVIVLMVGMRLSSRNTPSTSTAKNASPVAV